MAFGCLRIPGVGGEVPCSELEGKLSEGLLSHAYEGMTWFLEMLFEIMEM